MSSSLRRCLALPPSKHAHHPIDRNLGFPFVPFPATDLCNGENDKNVSVRFTGSPLFRTKRTDRFRPTAAPSSTSPPKPPAPATTTMSPTRTEPDSLSPLAAFPLDPTLTLTQRVRLNLSIYPDAGAGSKPVDHWQIKRALLDYLKTASRPLGAASLQISGAGDPKKRRRGDAVAHGVLVVRDLESVKEEDYGEWREKELRGRLDGIELVLEGARFRVSAEVPAADSFDKLRKEWQEYYAFKYKGPGRVAREEPDTIIVRGLPSRWFAETRVSSKPSMLVTHTIFSTLGSIRNIHVAEDDDFGEELGDDTAGLVSGLHCKVVVQFENQREFLNALQVLCGRSLEKEGTRLIADYEVSWDKDNFFQYSRSHLVENGGGRIISAQSGEIRRDVTRYASRQSPERARPKRFRE